MTTDPDITAEERQARRAARDRSERRRLIASLLVVALAMATAAIVVLQQFHNSTVVACQAAYNNAFAANLVQRSALGDRDREATKALIEGVFHPPASALKTQQTRQAYSERLFASYERTERAIQAQRAHHPYPQLPSRAC